LDAKLKQSQNKIVAGVDGKIIEVDESNIEIKNEKFSMFS
jgi:hypothetical protein